MLMALLGSHSANAAPIVTPSQTEGPFYPVTPQSDLDTDLTRVVGHARKAKGQEILVSGSVRDLDGKPLQGAVVEIWQACASGRYHHPSDPNDAPLDPDFQYWGKMTVGSSGAYKFRTIKPGAYPAARDWLRPPHIHFKVRRPGFPQLATQMYFEGEGLNGKDGILLALNPAQRKSVIVPFEDQKGVLAGRFDIVLGRLGRYSRELTPFLD